MTVTDREVSNRWPHIRRYLWVEPSGWVEAQFCWWACGERWLSPAERAAAYEEWADFYEFRLEQRADELAGDDSKRDLVAEWTDDMAYCCRHSAAYARGEDPGKWVPQWERRPDLAEAKRARVAKIIAVLDAEREMSRHLRKVG